MKRKGTSFHHRSENTYKFKTFSEQLTAVNVDVARRVQKLTATPEDADTFFSQALEKWTELNCTEYYTNFRREVIGNVQNLPQLVHHQKDIFDALCKHLRVPSSLAYEPLLDLVVQMARDLQSDFYVYFEVILPVLVELLQVYHHDVSILEQVFSCLSYLFKFLWRAMLADIKNVYRLIAPLLSEQYREYINNFAAEGFAFLMRKVKKFSELCEFMFADLADHPDRVSGLGRLMFESIKGVQKQFHSSAGNIVPAMLKLLGVQELPLEFVTECLEKAWSSMAEYVKRDHTTVVWDLLQCHIRATYEEWRAGAGIQKQQHAVNLCHSLRLLNVWISYREGALVVPAVNIAQMLTEMFTSEEPDDAFCEVLLMTTSKLVMAHHVTLTMREQGLLLHSAYKLQAHNDLLHGFTDTVLDLPLFEKDVLPCLLGFCGRCITKGNREDLESAIANLAKVIEHKAPSPLTTDMMSTYTTYLLDFGSVAKGSGDIRVAPKKLVKELEQLIADFNFEDLPLIWSLMICLPHIRPLDSNVCSKVVRNLLDQLINAASQSQLKSDEVICVITEGIHVLMTVHDGEEFFSHIPVTVITDLLRKYPGNVHSLRLAALYFAHASNLTVDSVLTVSTFEQIFPLVQESLSSPHSRVRTLTLQICCQFDLPMPTLPDDMADLEQIGVFRICLEAEKIETTVQAYRGKLVFLRKLDDDVVRNQVPLGPYQEVALRYLLGNLYINFTLLWGPVKDLINSHAIGMTPDIFWKVYTEQLTTAALHTEGLVAGEQQVAMVTTPQKQPEDAPSTTKTLEKDAIPVIFQRHLGVIMSNDRLDFHNFRSQLWQAMQLFSGLCENKSKIFVPLFFRFLEKEYYPANANVAPVQDLSKRIEEDDDQQEEEEEEDPVVEEDGKKVEKMVKIKPRRATNATLVTHLSLFSKLRNPKSVYREPELRELYFELLRHRSPDVQKVAFKCIMTYNYKYLTPYRENFERLMDDKSFKNEIVLFGISMETSVVATEHRKDMLPVLMALLYGKMQTKTGKDTSGKAHAQQRKAIVFRFLAGCQLHELHIFLDLVFKPYEYFLTGDIETNLDELLNNVDVTRVVPPRKQQGLLSTVEVVATKLGNLIDSYLPSLLRIIVGVLGQVMNLLDRREELRRPAVTSLKTLRQVALTQLNLFFKKFDRYPFSRQEIDTVFRVSVWPKLERLVSEGRYSPTGLLTIFLTWTRNSRYFGLLVKSLVENRFSALPFVFELLVTDGVHDKVVNVIMEMVHNLITAHELDEDDMDGEKAEQVVAIDVGPTIELAAADDLPFGVRILLPHVSVILTHLQKVVEVMLAQRGHIKTIPQRELDILARLSEHVTDSVQSDQVVSLLLPFLSRNLNRSPDVEVAILQTVTHLVRKSTQPAQFLRSMAEIFSSLLARVSRAALCQAVQAAAEKDPSIKVLADLVSQLNSWDRRYVDEPDYLARLDAFKLAQKLLHSPGDAHHNVLVLMLIHNCTFFLSTISDMSLRDVASLCLQEVVKSVAEQPEDESLFQDIIQKTMIPQLKRGLKLRSEAGRHEFIALVACLVKHYPTRPVFADLAKLTDPDPEGDFFANIVHIQMYRRARAIRRITRILSSHPFKAETLMMYVLPMVTAYVRDEEYLKQPVVVDATVDTIGGVCQCLPWPRYQFLLKYYLNLLPRSLDNQKLMVRLVVAILNGFHFDLKNAEEMKGAAVLPPAIGKKMKKNGDEVEDQQPETELGMTEVNEEEDAENQDLEQEAAVVTPTVGHVMVCSPSQATRIHRYIIKSFIPQLHKCLTRKSKSENEHKKAKAGKYAEDEEILRVPIALAMVKLLQNLPPKTLHLNLPSVLLKICHFLKSRSIDIRNTARDTLVKVIQSLGPSYFLYILKEMRSTLKRGYQIHVLTYTVHALLTSIELLLQTGSLDTSVGSLVAVFNDEVFGETAEEKAVAGITGNVMEARFSKSYDSYTIVAKYITKATLGKMMTPLKEVLERTNNRKVSRKVQEVFQRIMVGLVDNTSLSLGDLLTFIYSLTTEVMPMLDTKTDKSKQCPPQNPQQKPKSTYLLSKVTPRGGNKPKTDVKTNMHVIVEFGLQVLNTLLKRSKLEPTDLEHIKLLDPFVPMLTDCLTAKYIKVTSGALRCLTWLFKFPLPGLKKNKTAITNSLFVLLSNYAVAGAAKGDNFELVDMCFKAVTVLVRDVNYHKLESQQLRVLLMYAEQDIHDKERQATAFTLLKAVLSRKLVVPEMYEVMRKVEELAITADNAQVRQRCRQVTAQFLMDYPLGVNKVQTHLEFFVTQLEYEHEMGRNSALEMMAIIFETFPKTLVVKNAGFFFVPLASRLVNDESPKCRKLAALAIKQLLIQLDKGKRDELFNICLIWLQDEKVAVRKLAALTCSIMVEVEAVKFQRHLTTILPVLKLQIKPDKYDQTESEGEERDLDHLLYSLLNLLLKIVSQCDILRRPKWAKILNSMWDHLEQHLTFPHAWVRLVSAQLFGMLFAAWQPSELATPPSDKKSSSFYLQTNLMEKLHTLCGAFTAQLTSRMMEQALADQIVKNLVYLGKVLHQLEDAEKGEPPVKMRKVENVTDAVDSEDEEDEDPETTKTTSLSWLIRRLCREARTETATNPKVTIKRTSIFKWMAAMALQLGGAGLPAYLPSMLPVLVREVTDQSPHANADLRSLTQEVIDLMKATVGVETFTQQYASIQKNILDKRQNRKREKTQLMVSNPAVAARRKMKKNLGKQAAKKRKIEDYRPHKKTKKH